MTVDRAKEEGYHRPTNRYGAYQAIIPADFVECDICHRMSGMVWDFDSNDPDGVLTIQVCGDCAYEIDGRKRFIGQ